MSSSELQISLTTADEQILLDVVHASIASGLSSGAMLSLKADEYSVALQTLRATFVTLRIEGELRGCMGALKAAEPLVIDVSRNAYSAAFRDPRFSKMTGAEATRLDVHISILSPAEPLEFLSEEDLISKMRPGIDGLILYEGKQKGTLLPAVWDNIPDPRVFLAHLKKKANLSTDYWSPTMRVERYTAVSFGQGERPV